MMITLAEAIVCDDHGVVVVFVSGRFVTKSVDFQILLWDLVRL